jgi:glucosylceramidase
MENPSFQLDESVVHQEIAGFGASFLEAGMICLNSLDSQQQESVLRALFDPKDGAGFSAMKTVIAATDFMSAGPWYTYDETPGDVRLKHFSIQRDLGPNGLIPYIKRARKYGSFILQAPMDYPPDWMLVDVNSNQNVDKKYFHTLAQYYLRYLEEYQKNGIFIDYLSLFNEPLVYTKIPYASIRDLLKNDVGPLFAEHGVKTKIQLSEDPTRVGANDRYPILLDDPEARKYVASIPYHGYDFTRLKKPPTRENGYNFREFEKIAGFHKKYPDLLLWMTEVCYFGGTPWAKPLPRYDYEDSDFWVNQIISDLEAGASAWTYWNMILDQNGGPWLISPIHNDPDNNVQHPVVIIDRNTKKVSYTGLYYALAHFSKFVRPGSIRIGSAGNEPGVRCVAFKSPDGSFVAQLVNSRNEDAKVSVESHGRSLSLTLPPVSISTCLWK